MILTEYTVVTPMGSFQAMWDEDDSIPVSYAGDLSAIDYFTKYLQLETVTGAAGAVLAVEALEPADMYGFCQSPGYGIAVLPDAQDMLAYLAEDAADEGAAVLDSVGDDVAAEARLIIDQLNAGEGDRAELVDRLAFLLPQVEFADAEEEEAFQEAAAQAMTGEA